MATATTKFKIPPQIALCLTNSKRLIQDLQMLKQDFELLASSPTKDNQSIAVDRVYEVRRQVSAINTHVYALIDETKKIISQLPRSAEGNHDAA